MSTWFAISSADSALRWSTTSCTRQRTGVRSVGIVRRVVLRVLQTDVERSVVRRVVLGEIRGGDELAVNVEGHRLRGASGGGDRDSEVGAGSQRHQRGRREQVGRGAAARTRAHANLPVPGPVGEDPEPSRHVRGAGRRAVVPAGIEERVLEIRRQDVHANPRLDRELLGVEPRFVGHEDVASVEEAALHAGVGVDEARLPEHEGSRVAALGAAGGRRRIDSIQGVARLVVAVLEILLVVGHRTGRRVHEPPVRDDVGAVGDHRGVLVDEPGIGLLAQDVFAVVGRLGVHRRPRGRGLGSGRRPRIGGRGWRRGRRGVGLGVRGVQAGNLRATDEAEQQHNRQHEERRQRPRPINHPRLPSLGRSARPGQPDDAKIT